ncbi:hypothetical protein C8Q74DRAFT_716536 [Fomes fomentarius]|nr:hypothetical protein C8Q74DRAFT_716536 [Fomes fomentarius]
MQPQDYELIVLVAALAFCPLLAAVLFLYQKCVASSFLRPLQARHHVSRVKLTGHGYHGICDEEAIVESRSSAPVPSPTSISAISQEQHSLQSMPSGFPQSPPSPPVAAVDTENTSHTGSADIDDTQSLLTSSTCTLPPSYRTRRSYPDLSEHSQPDHLLSSSATGQPYSSGLDPPSASSVCSHAHHYNEDPKVDLSLSSLHVTHAKLSVESHSEMSTMEMRRSRDGGVRLAGGPLGKLNTEGGARPPSYEAELGPAGTHY